LFEGGLDERISKILDTCREKNILVSFGLTRKRMAEALNKKPRMSVVGIYNPDGSEIKGMRRRKGGEGGREDRVWRNKRG
jgi:hypothetical protein